MTIKSFKLAGTIFLLAAPVQWAGASTTPASFYPIETSRIEAAIASAHPGMGAVHLLTEPQARTAAPVLVAGPAEPAGARSVRIRMHCASPGECLPFYVEAGLGSSAAAQAGPKPGAAQPAILQAGSAVTLLLDSGRLHLRLAATALATAPSGAVVRVQIRPTPLSPGSHPLSRTVVATVVDAQTVRGDLP